MPSRRSSKASRGYCVRPGGGRPTHACPADRGGRPNRRAPRASKLLLAATLHDIGRGRPGAAPWPGLPHELSGAEFARCHLGERAAWIIAQHVPAKRYLVAVDAAYFAQLSPASVASLVRQGGPMNAEEVAEFRAHPNAEEAVTVRRWDDNAKDPSAPVLSVADVLAAYDRLHA